MKVLILAGGYGTRLSEETYRIPKPMVEIGNKPILWHIMKTYSKYGFNEFVILLGYKGYMIKEYFANYFIHQNDVTIDLEKNSIDFHANFCEPWKITLVDTGVNTMTGGRIKRAEKYIGNEPFMLTYGDGVSDINIDALILFHKKHGKSVTMTAVQPEGRFGAVSFDENNRVHGFLEKPPGDNSWVNGGFFVCEPEILEFIEGDSTILELEPFDAMIKRDSLYTYKHYGFWKPMDTLRDKKVLEDMWDSNSAKWKVWES